MHIRRAKAFVLSVVVCFFLFVLFILNNARGVQVSFSNGFQLRVLKTSYGQDHRYFSQSIRRIIAKYSVTEGLWESLEVRVPAFARFLRISNQCGSHQSRIPALVVFAEASREAGLPPCQLCPVASDGKEGPALQIDLFPPPPPFVDRFMLIADLDKQPSKLRIYEIDHRMKTRTLLAEVPVSKGPN